MTRSQPPWPEYEGYQSEGLTGDMRERLRALEVQFQTGQQQSRSDLQAIWSHMQGQDARISRNEERLLHHERKMTDYARALDDSNKEHRRRAEQIGHTVKVVFAACKWIAAVILIAASATGRMTGETAKALLSLFGG